MATLSDRDIELYADNRVSIKDIERQDHIVSGMALEIQQWRVRARAAKPVDIAGVLAEFRKALKLPSAGDVAERRGTWVASQQDYKVCMELIVEALDKAEAAMLDDPTMDPTGTRRASPDGKRKVIRVDNYQEYPWMVYEGSRDSYRDRTVKGWAKL